MKMKMSIPKLIATNICNNSCLSHPNFSYIWKVSSTKKNDRMMVSNLRMVDFIWSNAHVSILCRTKTKVTMKLIDEHQLNEKMKRHSSILRFSLTPTQIYWVPNDGWRSISRWHISFAFRVYAGDQSGAELHSYHIKYHFWILHATALSMSIIKCLSILLDLYCCFVHLNF